MGQPHDTGVVVAIIISDEVKAIVNARAPTLKTDDMFRHARRERADLWALKRDRLAVETCATGIGVRG